MEHVTPAGRAYAAAAMANGPDHRLPGQVAESGRPNLEPTVRRPCAVTVGPELVVMIHDYRYHRIIIGLLLTRLQ
jgi:hypothetical protein